MKSKYIKKYILYFIFLFILIIILSNLYHNFFILREGNIFKKAGKTVSSGVSQGVNAVSSGVNQGVNTVSSGVNQGVNAVSSGVNIVIDEATQIDDRILQALPLPLQNVFQKLIDSIDGFKNDINNLSLFMSEYQPGIQYISNNNNNNNLKGKLGGGQSKLSKKISAERGSQQAEVADVEAQRLAAENANQTKAAELAAQHLAQVAGLDQVGVKPNQFKSKFM